MTATLAIVGPTATGKSRLAMALAERLGRVEIVSVDSMQLYRGMDIGTAKPSVEDRRLVPHHLIDLLDPQEESSVGWFQKVATTAREGIAGRGAAAVMAGGTGLYHRAVIDHLDIPGQWPVVAAQVEAEGDTAALHRRLATLDPVAADRVEPSNRRRIVRALEVTIGGGRPFSDYGPGLDHYPPTDVVQIGLGLDRAVLSDRLAARFDRQLDQGLLAEVAALEVRPEGWSRTAAQALGYRELLDHLRDGRPLAECRELAVKRIRRFAVRQERWFRRDPRVMWLDADRSDLVEATLERWDP